MRREDIMDVLYIALITVVVIAIISLISITIVWTHKEFRKPAPHPTYIDTTKVQVLYTDTWGKIFIMKEEDL